LAGRLIREEDCKVINLPAECDSADDLLGREIGDALCPEMGKDKVWLQSFKESFMRSEGSSTWYSMFQGNPISEGGNIIKKDWWKYYTLTDDFLKSLDELVMSVDATFKDTGDYVSIQCWGRKGNFFYLVDLINEQLDFPKTVSAIMGMKGMFPKIRQIYVEDKANGSAVIAILKKEVVGIVAVEPIGGKISRVNAVAPAIESGNVYLPENKHFVKDFINQCSAFPNGKHDDMVDSMSQALSKLIFKKTYAEKTRGNTMMDFFKVKPKSTSTGKGEKINVV
jgi:predicted phage terminase large subunit-like protein